VTARERVDLSAVDLFASIGRPIASNLKGGAAIEPDPPPFVFSGTPVLVFAEADDLDQIDLTWDGGRMTLPVVFIENDIGEALRLLRGSRLITDWESRYPATEALATLAKREEGRVSARLRLSARIMGLPAPAQRERLGCVATHLRVRRACYYATGLELEVP
jgi:hypothetical protein